MTPPPHPRSPPALMDELIGEILLRVPPDEPAHLFRASLVCKSWRSLLSDPTFLRRYRKFHRTPPLLGFFRYKFDLDGPKLRFKLRFVSTTASPFSATEYSLPNWWTLDSRHGRVLLYKFDDSGMVFNLWDPITGDQHGFRMSNLERTSLKAFSAAVLCVADSCDHLDCHGGPFIVVLAGADEDGAAWVTDFSSESGAWSASKRVGLEVGSYLKEGQSLVTGDAVYFTLELGRAILKYDLSGRGLQVIDTPEPKRTGIVMMAEDGGLGFAVVKDHNIYLYSWKANAEGISGWVQLRVIELKTLISPLEGYIQSPLIGFAEGTDTIFISTYNFIFKLKLKSGQITKVGQAFGYGGIVPYMSFYTPDLVGVRLLPCPIH